MSVTYGRGTGRPRSPPSSSDPSTLLVGSRRRTAFESDVTARISGSNTEVPQKKWTRFQAAFAAVVDDSSNAIGLT
jgi:hypothetical protein